jgi:PKD repeat protein
VNVNSKKWLLVLSALSLLALIGCTAAPAPPAAKPTISSFAASPTSINQGDQTVLSWDVSGATTITIEPNIGKMGPSGSLTLTPNATVTYTLTASNEAGSATSSTTINVTPVVAGMPDLVITGMFLQGSQIYYTIKNQGNAAAGQTETAFYIGNVDYAAQTITWLKQTTNFVDNLAPGESRQQAFSNYDWRFGNVDPITGELLTFNVKACANAANSITESDTSNDCLIEVWGPEFIYDFVQKAHLAKWTSGAGTLRWPMSNLSNDGAAYSITYSPILVTCPQKVSQGWIIGKYGDFYTDPVSRASMVRDLKIPMLAHFTSKVGFAPGVNSPGGVTVALGYYDEMGALQYFNKMSVMSDGQMHDYNVDLSSLAGKKTQFVLFIQANGSPENTCVRWDSPKITQTTQPF